MSAKINYSEATDLVYEVTIIYLQLNARKCKLDGCSPLQLNPGVL